MRTLVSYDVSDDEVRRRIASLLGDVLSRVQYSVFEGEPPEDVLSAKVSAAVGLLDPETDSIRVYRFCGTCAGRVDSYGRGPGEGPSAVRVL